MLQSTAFDSREPTNRSVLTGVGLHRFDNRDLLLGREHDLRPPFCGRDIPDAVGHTAVGDRFTHTRIHCA